MEEMALSQSISFPVLHSPFYKLQLFGVSGNPGGLINTTAKTPKYPFVSLCCHTARSNRRTIIGCVAGGFMDDAAKEASSSSSTSISSIFVKGLEDSVSEGRLKKVFSEFGQVSHVKIIVNERTRQSLGYGYVWFNKKEDAQLAVDAMNGKVYTC